MAKIIVTLVDKKNRITLNGKELHPIVKNKVEKTPEVIDALNKKLIVFVADVEEKLPVEKGDAFTMSTAEQIEVSKGDLIEAEKGTQGKNLAEEIVEEVVTEGDQVVKKKRGPKKKSES